MEVSAKELRGKPGEVIEKAARGAEVIITLRGRKMARMVPYENKKTQNIEHDDEIFGLWKDTEDTSVEEQVRQLRKGRSF